jgi:choline/glycine/proline betaine transport protein
MFGLATSLGFGVLQINAGLNYLIGVPVSLTVQVGLVVVVTALATASAISGLDKGVRILSELNLSLAVLLMLFVLVVGPTGLLMRDFVQNIGLYLDSILLRTFNIYAYEPRPWIDKWTLFYWAWWISWSPFVGMFIARISRGRTVREFVVAVLFIPAGFTFFWMTVFGNTAMEIDTTVANGALAKAVQADLSVALFQFFQYLPFPAVTSTLTVMLIAIFFVTSADSGSLVMDTIAAGGRTDTPFLQRIFWCVMAGAVAAVLLAAGGLSALQSATISTALPFSIVMLVLVWSLFAGMKADVANSLTQTAAVPQAYPASGMAWQKRLALLLRAPDARDIDRFLETAVSPALHAVAKELQARSRAAEVEYDRETGTITLTAPADDVRNFIYGVRRTEYKLPAFTAYDATRTNFRYEAYTFFADGSRGYDIMGMSQEQIINDVLVKFERYILQSQYQATSLMTAAPEH